MVMALRCGSAPALLLLGAVSALTPAKSFEWVSVLTNATSGFCTGEDTSGMEEVKQNENSRQETEPIIAMGHEYKRDDMHGF